MLLSDRRPSSKMDTAITVLQHLATLAAYDGESCAKVLFQAADYLQDLLDCMPELEGSQASGADMAEFEALIARLATVMPEDSQTLHS